MNQHALRERARAGVAALKLLAKNSSQMSVWALMSALIIAVAFFVILYPPMGVLQSRRNGQQKASVYSYES